MNKSESIGKIAPALVKAQAAIKAAIKDSTNPHFRSKYADLGAVVEAVKPALLAHELTFLQGVEDADNGVRVETMLLHSSGEWISSTLRIPASKQDAQGYGSAITYGRRYGLQSMCGVPAEDDDGEAARIAKDATDKAEKTAKESAQVDPEIKKTLEQCASLESLQTAWMKLTAPQMRAHEAIKDACKKRILEADEMTQA